MPSTRPSLARPAAAAAAALLLALGVAACGDDDDAGDATEVVDGGTTAAPDGTGDDVTDGGAPSVVAEDFELSSASAPAGETVSFANVGAAPHTMTADDGSFDSGRVEPGGSTEVQAPDQPGDYGFHCSIHPAMTATLTVE